MAKATANEISAEIALDLSRIILKMQNDLDGLKTLRDALEDYSSDEEYNGQFFHTVTEAILGLTNNSGWIGYAGSAIRSAKAGA